MIGLKLGNIEDVRDVDIWVNSENTSMEMSRFFEKSISGTIRYMGAEKDHAGDVTKDTIANEHNGKMGEKLRVQSATVLATGSGRLKETNNVQKILHVASVEGQVSVGYKPIGKIERCVSEILADADSERMLDTRFSSILFPLMGAS